MRIAGAATHQPCGAGTGIYIGLGVKQFPKDCQLKAIPAMTSLLQFPKAFRQMRMRRGLMQKVVALELGLDAAVLCGIEKGTRIPLDETLLARAANLFQLSADEFADMTWAAHHDRLITGLTSKGASDEEILLISESLCAWHHLKSDQREGWLSTVKRLRESARAVATLSSPIGGMEAHMT